MRGVWDIYNQYLLDGLSLWEKDFILPPTDSCLLLLQADTAYERIFTVNDVEHGGCKYGIVNLSGLRKDSLTVEMYDNLYFTNRKVLFTM